MALTSVGPRICTAEDTSVVSSSRKPVQQGCCPQRNRTQQVVAVVAGAAFVGLLVAGLVTGNRTMALWSIAPGAIAAGFTVSCCRNANVARLQQRHHSLEREHHEQVVT